MVKGFRAEVARCRVQVDFVYAILRGLTYLVEVSFPHDLQYNLPSLDSTCASQHTDLFQKILFR